MRETVEVQSPAAAPQGDRLLNVRNLLLLSTVALVVQVSITDYGSDESGAAAFWLAIGCLMLWLVYRKHSRVARGIVVVSSMVGAVMYAFGFFGDLNAAALVLAYLGQAVPLLLNPVRRHVSPALR